MIIEVNMAIKIEAPEEHAKRILSGDTSAFLSTIYTPNEKRGKWWVEGNSVIKDSGKTIAVK